MKYFSNGSSSNETTKQQLEKQRTRETEMRQQNQEQIQLPNGNDDGGEVGRPLL